MKYNLLLVHLIIILLATVFNFSVATWLGNDVFFMVGRAYPSLLIVSLIASVLSFFVSNQKSVNATTQIPQLIFKIIEYMVLQSFLILIYWFAVNSIHYNKEHISTFLILNTISLLIINYLYIQFLRRKRIGIPIVKTIVLGENRFVQQFINSLNDNHWIGFDYKSSYNSETFFQSSFKDYMLENEIEAVFINWDEFNLNKERELQMRNMTEEYGIKFYAISEFFGNYLLPSSYNLSGNFPYIQLFKFPLDNPIKSTSKRVFDIFFSIVFFVTIASWLFPIIIILLWINQGFPIFFSQKRHGVDNIEFDCYKFRTMVINKEGNKSITVRNDPRVTKIGRILRKTSFDELPQFWNVLKGEMSIVGPRPHMLEQNFYYNDLIQKYNFRHYVKPGITGLAQVSGFRGEIKENKDMKDRVQSDLYYIRNWSFGLDISIIYRTVANMIKGDKNAI
ncbi:exopolysaccharide biosynthesis polyprenyl glycosylphosphotransferase [Flavobacteriaceae bacterium Ap0902]|nr:exopolysaccharide biosynthesis polyprenyl glycosylphosphotransferase [Flavobacteriaceae bacterium Ap0902]